MQYSYHKVKFYHNSSVFHTSEILQNCEYNILGQQYKKLGFQIRMIPLSLPNDAPWSGFWDSSASNQWESEDFIDF